MSDPKRPSSFAAAVAGGVIGSLLTAVLMIFAAPQWLSSRIVREGMLADPQILADTADSLRDAQYAPTLRPTGPRSKHRSEARGKAPPSLTSLWSNSSITPAPIARRAIPTSTGCTKRTRACASSIGSFRSSGRTAFLPRGCRSRRRSWAVSPSSTTLVGGRPARRRKRSPWRRKPPESRPRPKMIRRVEAELRRNFQLAGQLGATGTPLFVIGNRVMNAAVGYDALKKAVADARRNKS